MREYRQAIRRIEKAFRDDAQVGRALQLLEQQVDKANESVATELRDDLYTSLVGRLDLASQTTQRYITAGYRSATMAVALLDLRHARWRSSFASATMAVALLDLRHVRWRSSFARFPPTRNLASWPQVNTRRRWRASSTP